MIAGLFVVALVASTISATLGVAGGLVLLSALTFFFPLTVAIPLHGAAQVLSNVGRVVSHYRDTEWRIALRFIILVVPGALLGVQLIKHANPWMLEGALGVFILALLYVPLPGTQQAFPLWVFTVLGFGSSFLGMLVGATGPLIAPFFFGQGLDKKRLIATKAFCQLVNQGTKVPVFALAADFDWFARGEVVTTLFVGVIAGTAVGNQLLDRLSQRGYERIVRIALTLLAGRMLYRAGMHLFGTP